LGTETEDANKGKSGGKAEENGDFGEDATGGDATEDEREIRIHCPGSRRAVAESPQERGDPFAGPQTAGRRGATE